MWLIPGNERGVSTSGDDRKAGRPTREAPKAIMARSGRWSNINERHILYVYTATGRGNWLPLLLLLPGRQVG